MMVEPTETGMREAEMVLDALFSSWRTMERAADIIAHHGLADEAIYLRHAANQCRNAIAALRAAHVPRAALEGK